jgi:hypothetical protein
MSGADRVRLLRTAWQCTVEGASTSGLHTPRGFFMPANSFLARFGFIADPFESTNAETEPYLDRYFVPPPYFVGVMGDPSTPVSHVVLAPRGGGKTAQRRMIEDYSASSGDFLCVTYDSFDQSPGFNPKTVDLAYHLNQICRLLLLGILSHLDEHPEVSDRLSAHQKAVLKFGAERFLGSLSIQEFETALRSVKNLGDKASDVWRKYGGPIAVAIQALLARAGLNDVKVPTELASEIRRDETLRYQFEALIGIAQSMGFRSTYVLVDKVDEIPSTASDAEATFDLIRPLATDLPTLETPGCGFKFFLWDHIGTMYREGGGRPDRVQILELDWSTTQLQEMLEQRLLAYSDGQVSHLTQMMCDPTLNLDLLVAYLAQGSPRDMIRVTKSIINEETRVSTESLCLSENSVWAGIKRFAENRSQELYPEGMLADLRRVHSPTFTINFVASDVFHTSTEAGRSKIQKWLSAGIVKQVGEVPNKGNRPLHLYGIVDLRVAISMLTDSEIELVLGNFAILCPQCGGLAISAETSIGCTHCGLNFQLDGAPTVLDAIRSA